jgi:hypothetical protein
MPVLRCVPGLGIARARLEEIKKTFPEISYADLYTLASVVAIEEMGGPKVAWRSGRTDSKVRPLVREIKASCTRVRDGVLLNRNQMAAHQMAACRMQLRALITFATCFTPRASTTRKLSRWLAAMPSVACTWIALDSTGNHCSSWFRWSSFCWRWHTSEGGDSCIVGQHLDARAHHLQQPVLCGLDERDVVACAQLEGQHAVRKRQGLDHVAGGHCDSQGSRVPQVG